MRPEPAGLTRRDALRLAAAVPMACVGRGVAAADGAGFDLAALRAAAGRVVLEDGTAAPPTVILTRHWRGAVCRASLRNDGRSAVSIAEVVLCDLPHGLPPQTRLYGEGFQMLSQTGGTLAAPRALGNFTDAGHYRMPQPKDALVAYGLLTLSAPDGTQRLVGFSSCRRFVGQLRLRGPSLEAALDCEGRELGPGESWELEDLRIGIGLSRAALLDELAGAIARDLPPLRFAAPPTGWCSWYCFGPRVTAQQVLDNLDVIAERMPGLRYVQIDDGYQPAMGDWLETGAAFGGDVQGVLRQIRARGFYPAIWVAPFVAEEKSRLFAAHPDWFVKDDSGAPLRSDRVTFGGWRRGPWYVLDGTHPQAQRHLEQVFETMSAGWGCSYFKLDANFWGAIHGGRFHDPRATRVEAYRRGMQAVRRGAGSAFVLGCNHPIWPSFGLVDGSRSSNDIKRTWARIADTARQNLSRNWQNGRLWWNDPDAVVLGGELGQAELSFHATAICAAGAMVLSGDDLTRLPPERMAILRKLLPPLAVAARFEDDSLQAGTVALADRRLVCLLNWDDAPTRRSVALAGREQVVDLWTGADLGTREGALTVELPARSGRVLVCRGRP